MNAILQPARLFYKHVVEFYFYIEVSRELKRYVIEKPGMQEKVLENV